jgi:hypothetical protein
LHVSRDRLQAGDFFALLEQTPSERRRIQGPLKLLVYETMAN